jgi:H+/Na+-translocating ferredoxin:NAD+ oxidoreductase subunit G
MTVTCALGAALLGGVFIATDRYQRAARERGEREAVAALLNLDATARVLQVRQYVDPLRGEVIYRSEPEGSAPTELRFSYEGALLKRDSTRRGGDDDRGLQPLGRFFVAARGNAPAGFVIEDETRGYKNRIRFFVGLTPDWEVSGVRVIEHEEDPGLGAEIATPWFQGQFDRRPAAALGDLAVTRDPMPEDWRAALLERGRVSAPAWEARHRSIQERETRMPIYAVTGATISSRAITDGVRSAVLHFQRRWALVRPYLGGAP